MAGQFELFGAGGQTLLRILPGFFVIVVSWLYYRLAVMISYMGLTQYSFDS